MYHLCKWASSLLLWWASPVSIQWRYLILVCVLYSLWGVTVTDDNAQDCCQCCPGGNAEKSKTHYAVMTQWHSEQLANTFHINWAVNTLITPTSSWLAITQYANKQSHYKNIKTLILSDSPHSLTQVDGTSMWDVGPFHFQNICGRNLVSNCKTIWRFKK